MEEVHAGEAASILGEGKKDVIQCLNNKGGLGRE